MTASRSADGADLLARVSAEIIARRDSLRAAVDEYQQLLTAIDAIGEQKPTSTSSGRARRSAPAATKPKAKAAPKRKAAPKAEAKGTPKAKALAAPGGADQQAILAALEHGSHTVVELTVVTAMSAPSIRAALKALSKAGRVSRAEREGKAAYVLAG